MLVLLACGLVELGWRRRPGTGAAAFSPAMALVLAVTGAAALPALAWTALKVGALSYGGGFVIIPLMQDDAVDTYGWMTDAEFANAVAYGQLTPGPVVHTVAIVGWAAAGLGGALLAAAIAFAPSFVVVGRDRRAVRAAARARARRGRSSTAPARPPWARSSARRSRSCDALEEAWQWAVLAAAALPLALGRPPFWALWAARAGWRRCGGRRS